MRIQYVLSAVLLVSMLGAGPSGFSQGSLTPPGGPPAPTMKTLDQIDAKLEKRTPISALPCSILTSGSYYLTTNLVEQGGGMWIIANNVTLDLNGFTVAGTGATASAGISISSFQTNIVIQNGMVKGWNTYGILGMNLDSVRIQRLEVTGCGQTAINLAGANIVVADCVVHRNGYTGISVGNDSIVSSCLVSSNATMGIQTGYGAVVQDCLVHDQGSAGVVAGNKCRVLRCQSRRINGMGIATGDLCVVENCLVQEAAQQGISAGNGSRVSGCLVSGGGGLAIQVSSGSVVTGNTCMTNNPLGATSGIWVNGTNIRVEDNHVVATGPYGIYAPGFTTNIIVRNMVSGSGTNNYNLGVYQVAGPIITGTGTITNVNPWANFSF